MRFAVFHIGAMNPVSVGGRFWPLIKYLTSQGHDVTAIVPASTAQVVRRECPEVRAVALFQPFRRLTKFNFVANAAAGLVHALCLRVRVDVSLALTGVVYDALAAKRLARFCGGLAVAYVDNMPLRKRPEQTWWTMLDRVSGHVAEKLYRTLDLILAGSRSVANDLCILGLPSNRIHVTGYGVGGSDLESAKRLGIEKVEGRVVYLGRFSRAKGIFDLLQIWPRVVTSVPDATLHVMGIGHEDEMSKVRRSIDGSPVASTIALLGFVNEQQKYSELLAADVMAFPTYSEQYSQAVAEALACDARIVGYDIDGFRGNFPGLIDVGPPGDLESLASRIIAALNSRNAPRAEIPLSYDPFFDKEIEAIGTRLRKTA